MFYRQIAKSIWTITFLLGSTLAVVNLNAALWSPNPPAAIPGAEAVTSDDSFISIVTTYDESNDTIVATWLDGSNIPTYAVWNGTQWTTPATNIPGATALNSFAIPIYSTYNSSNNTIVTTWTDASNNPTYTIWDGSSWTTPAAIPGGSTASYFSVYTTYDAANKTTVAVWADNDTASPTYAVLSGSTWTDSAIIPGSLSVDTVVLSTYSSGNRTVIATWVNTDSNPSYAVWDGSSWIVEAAVIPGAGLIESVYTVTPICNPSDGTVLVTWIQSASGTPIPTYAVLSGTTWTVSATSISDTTTAEAMFFSTYDAANQTILTTWLDETETLMYSVWDGSTWTTAAAIPGAEENSFLLLQPVYDAGSRTIIATWFGLGTGSTFTPSYAVWDGSTWTVPTTAIPGASVLTFSEFASFLYEIYDTANQTVMVTWIDTNGFPTYATYINSVATAESFSGHVTNNHFLTQTDRINKLVWTPSNDSSITGYALSRNGKLIFSAPASGPYKYEDHNRNKKVKDTYTLVSQGLNGLVSLPLTVVLP